MTSVNSRRAFLRTLTAGALAAPLAAHPQQVRHVYQVGSLTALSSSQPGGLPLSDTPAWMQSLPTLTWHTLPTKVADAQAGLASPGGNPVNICAWSGACVKTSGSVVLLCGGGHVDYAGNEVYALRLADDVPVWKLLRPPTASVTTDVAYYSDGRPSSRHTYWALFWLETRQRMVMPGCTAPWGHVTPNFPVMDGFNPATNDYDPAGTFATMNARPYAGITTVKDDLDNIYVHIANRGDLVKWIQATNTWSSLGNRSAYNIDTPYCHDPVRHRIVRFSAGDAPPMYLDLAARAKEVPITFRGPFASKAGRNGTVVWCPDRQSFLIYKWNETNVYECDPSGFQVSQVAVGGVPPVLAAADGNGNLYGRFAYVPELKGCVVIPGADKPVSFFRTG